MTEPRKKRDANDVVPHRVELAGQTVAGGVGSAFGAAKLRDEYKREHPAKFDRKVLRGTNRAIKMGAKPEQVTRAVHAVQAGKPPFRALVTAAGAGGVAAAAHHYQQINDWSKKRKAQVGALVKTSAFEIPAAPGNRTVGPRVRVRATPPARHAVRPYAGAHRKLSPLDHVKATAILHSKHLAGAMEGITDLFKAWCPRCAEMVPDEARYAHHAQFGKVRILGHHGGGQVHVLDGRDEGRVVHQDTLRIIRAKDTGMTKSAFGVELLSKTRRDLVPPEGRPTTNPKRIEDMRAARRNRIPKPGTDGAKLAVKAAEAVKKSAFDPEIEKAHVLRDVAALGGATAAGALLAKPGLAASVGKVAKTRVARPFMRSFRNPAGGGRPMPGPGPIGKASEPTELFKASAFGVELAKAEKKKPSAGRVAAGTAFSGLHGAVAGKKGKKLKATGSEIGHSLGGGVLGSIPGAILKKPALSAAGGYGGGYGGAAAAVYSNQRKGRYKRES